MESGVKAMSQDNGTFGWIIGGIVAVAAAIFIFSGGELGGKKTVEADQDLPPIATSDQN
jgi:hypothetical protein